MTPFTQILASLDVGQSLINMPEDWKQGRTTYGGMTAALCVEAALKGLPDLPPLRSAQFAFIGPASGPLTITPSVLRRGKSAVFVAVDVLGEDGHVARSLLNFGARRTSGILLEAAAPPDVPRPEACEAYFSSATGPRFAQHFDIRLAAGARPMTPDAEPDLMIWSRHRDPLASDSLSGIVALADALPPPIIIRFTRPAPFSTSTWSFDLLTDTPQDDDGWWLLRSRADTARDGYSTQTMTLWGAGGAPVMVARQNVAIFDTP
jgi:acyl-CoA thioesterase